jgi:hypothetical protein
MESAESARTQSRDSQSLTYEETVPASGLYSPASKTCHRITGAVVFEIWIVDLEVFRAHMTAFHIPTYRLYRFPFAISGASLDVVFAYVDVHLQDGILE